MATPLTNTTFLSTYNDDFTDSDHYHRILFNNGRALQARELTQSQTIIQKEIARMAGFIFNEGGMFGTSPGSLLSGNNAVNFVKVTSLPTGYASLVDTVIQNSAGVKAIVKAIVPATGGDADTLLVVYTTSNNLTSSVTTTGPRIFQAGEALTSSLGAEYNMTIQTTDTSVNPATGKGSFIEVPQFNTFVAGHLIMVEKQNLVLSKYDANPTAVVGFKLTQQVVTTSDDIALYDNSGATPNLTSPGADRYQILMTLTTADDVDSDETFYPIFDVKQGVARQLKTKDNLLSEVGDILNGRTQDITGNFVVRNSEFGQFKLEIEQDSDDDYLLYRVDGGIGFVGGNRIEKAIDTEIRSLKPRNTSKDIDTITNEFISARYGNYFLADSMYGIIGGIDTLATVNLYTSANRGGTNIGTARVRSVDEFDNEYRIHIFDLSLNANKSVSTIRSIGTSASNYANLKAINAKYDIVDKEDTSLIFPLPRNKINTVSSVSTNVGRIYTATSDGSGQATFNTGGNTFQDQENWIVTVDSSGEVFSPPTVSGTPNTAATITGLPTGSAVKMYGFESKSLVLKTKTLVTGRSQAGLSLSNRRFTLDKADIYKITSIVDDTTSEDVTYRYITDTGQRDDYYTVGGGRLKNGFGAPASTITVTYDYFTHSAGDYFGGKASYPDIELKDIPLYTTSQNETYRLSDVIDMRPVKNNTGANFTGTGAVIEDIPKNTATITIGEVQYWQPRSDVIALRPDGNIKLYEGRTDTVPEISKNIPSEDMKLHRIDLAPYVVDEKDLVDKEYDNLGYKMGDIRRLENRLQNLEEFSVLTSVELANLRTTVSDPDDATLPDRVKLGLTADGFRSNINSAVEDIDYRAFISKSFGTLAPFGFKRQTSLHYDSDNSAGTIRKGTKIWPKYDEEVMVRQEVASSAIDVNQFQSTKSIGAGDLEPNVDTWQITKKVDEHYQVGSTESYIPRGTKSVSSQGQNRG